MRKTEFFEAMEEKMAEFGEVKREVITKPDVSYTGLILNPIDEVNEAKLTPVINLDRLYEDYEAGKSFDWCVDKAKEISKMRPTDVDLKNLLPKITEWETAKNMLFLRLCGTLSSGLSRDIADIKLVPYLQLTPDGTQTARVNEGLMRSWGVSEEEIFTQAKVNQETLRPVKIDKLNELLGIPDGVGPTMLVVTTLTGVCGASAILYDGIADDIREALGEDFYILPSSIHEVIVIPKSFTDDTNKLRATVKAVNNNALADDERLSNSIYVFENNELTAIA